MKVRVIFILLCCVILTTQAQITVGPDVNCDYSTVQEAIDNGNELSIHLSNESIFRENLVFQGYSDYVITGGYNNCLDAANNVPSQFKTILSGDLDDDNVGDDPVMKITGEGIIRLSGLRLTEGFESFSFTSLGGGLSIYNFDGTIHLSNVDISNNQGYLGGGVSINGSNTDLKIGDNVFVLGNRSSVNGGGIWCSGQSSIDFSVEATNSGVAANTANSNGGGVYLQSSCSMTFHNGMPSALDGDFRGIYANKANGNGGGIYLSSGAQLELSGIAGNVANVTFNTADYDNDNNGNGGGIYATDLSTHITASNVMIGYNYAINGGGVYLDASATMQVQKTSKYCWNTNHCNLFTFNYGKLAGGAIYANDQAIFDIKQTLFNYNRSALATTIHLNNKALGNTSANIFSNNGDNGSNSIEDKYVVNLLKGSTLYSTFDTYVENNASEAVISFTHDIQSGPNTVLFYGNIVDDASTGDVSDLNGSTAQTLFACLIVHEDSSTFGDNIIEANPEFVNKLAEDFHLLTTSPAIDLCSEDAIEFPQDFDSNFKAWDSPDSPGTGEFIADAGAFESYAADIIFKNGFD